MSSFLCDMCDAEFPGGASGTSFLVINQRTCRFCSGACLRSYVNRSPTALVTPTMAAFVSGMVTLFLVAMLHIVKLIP